MPAERPLAEYENASPLEQRVFRWARWPERKRCEMTKEQILSLCKRVEIHDVPFDEYIAVEKVKAALGAAAEELARARVAYPPFHSTHEGMAVLQEEVDELWEVVKDVGKPTTPTMAEKQMLREEAGQVAAMALRFMVELT